MSDPMTTETAEMFLRQRDEALAVLAQVRERFEAYVAVSQHKAAEFGDRCRSAEAERDAYKAALEALVEASEEFFRPNSLGAPLWPRTVDARSVLAGESSTTEE